MTVESLASHSRALPLRIGRELTERDRVADGLPSAESPLTVEVELVHGEPQVVLYLENERLGVVLPPPVARSLAASLENAADRIAMEARR